MNILTVIARIIIGFGAGLVVSGGVVAFISVIELIPMMAYRSNTAFAMLWYENAIILGSIVGSFFSMWRIRLPYWPPLVIAFFFAFGIFVGVLIIALAEVINVIPVIDRRIQIKKGITWIIVAFALGKLVGSLCYWLSPYFVEIIVG